MPEHAPLSPGAIRDSLTDFFGEKADTVVVTSGETIDAQLYRAVNYRCGYSEWHQGVWEFQSTITFAGVRTQAIGSIERGIYLPGISTMAELNDEFLRVDEHCRLLLPDKYLERLDGLYESHSQRPVR